MKKIGIFYAPKGGSTDKVAKIVANCIGLENVELVLITHNTPADELKKYDNLILGISTVGKDTWSTSYAKSGWDWLLPKLDEVDFKDKKVALFGLGNQITYPQHFVDSLGILGKKVLSLSANVIGQCPTASYTEFKESQAIINGEFIGLPVDEDNEDEMTEKRVKDWIARIKDQFI